MGQTGVRSGANERSVAGANRRSVRGEHVFAFGGTFPTDRPRTGAPAPNF